MTSVLFKGDGTSKKEVSRVGLPTGRMQLGPGCWACGELSGPLPTLFVLNVSVFDTLEPPSAD